MADNGIEIEGLVFEAGAGAGRDSGSSPVDARSRAVAPTLTEDALALDRSPRPKRLGDYLGQTKIKESLAILIEAAQARGDVVDHILFSGPPGLGKTMVACGLGLQAVNSGYTVCFEKMTNLIRILDTAETERAAGFRLKNIRKAQLVIIDEIGYTPISRGQANRFFTFISDTYETSSIIFTTNKEIVDWAEMMGDPVLTTAMLDRILHHAKCYSCRGESYRLKHPDLYPQG